MKLLKESYFCGRILVFSRDICFDSPLDSASADAEGRACFQMPGQDPGERGGKADVEAAQVEKHQHVTSIWLGMGVIMMYIETENLEATSSFLCNTAIFPYK